MAVKGSLMSLGGRLYIKIHANEIKCLSTRQRIRLLLRFAAAVLNDIGLCLVVYGLAHPVGLSYLDVYIRRCHAGRVRR